MAAESVIDLVITGDQSLVLIARLDPPLDREEPLRLDRDGLLRRGGEPLHHVPAALLVWLDRQGGLLIRDLAGGVDRFCPFAGKD